MMWIGVTEAARRLGIARQTLHRRLQRMRQAHPDLVRDDGYRLWISVDELLRVCAYEHPHGAESDAERRAAELEARVARLEAVVSHMSQEPA